MIKVMVVIFAAALLAACASPRLYPVCFYNDKPPTGRKAEALYGSLSNALSTSLGSQRDIKVAVSPDGRWLVASATDSENAAAAEVWPRVGCIGSATNSDQTNAEASCVRYVRTFVSTGNYFEFGNAKDKGGIDIWNETTIPNDVVHCNTTLTK